MFMPIPSNPLFHFATNNHDQDSSAAAGPMFSDLKADSYINHNEMQGGPSTIYPPLFTEREIIFIERIPLSTTSAGSMPSNHQLHNLLPTFQRWDLPFPQHWKQPEEESHKPTIDSPKVNRPSSDHVPSMTMGTSKSSHRSRVTAEPKMPTVPSKRHIVPAQSPQKRSRVEARESTDSSAAHSTNYSSVSNVHIWNRQEDKERRTDNDMNIRSHTTSNRQSQSEQHRAEIAHVGPRIPLRQNSKVEQTGSRKSQDKDQRPKRHTVSDDAESKNTVEQPPNSQTENTISPRSKTETQHPGHLSRSQALIPGKHHKAHKSSNHCDKATEGVTKARHVAANGMHNKPPIPQQRKTKSPIEKIQLVKWKNDLSTASYLLASRELTEAQSVNAYQTLCGIEWYQEMYDDSVWSLQTLKDTGLIESLNAVIGRDANGNQVDTRRVGQWDQKSREIAERILNRWFEHFQYRQPLKPARI
ncbi:hypothetical protein CVT24_002048 [Panaeolus cyanescens]|uniref:Uncharacterized protein n=1 Tax=Panaeolus cyanescens TaxID=181874 RepID=A0A409YHK0_9AGAR|nr:hypothetical protein CVT24_002048 [Panaeolus cyanescens]